MVATGSVIAIFTVDRMKAPMQQVGQINAIAGKGLEGDRYFLGTGTYSKKPKPDRQVTLIQSEILESLKTKFDITVKPDESRRNILTKGIEINDLIGTEFFVGPVRLKAHRLTRPCLYLENLLNQPGLYNELWENGGISCEILSGGVITAGDVITAAVD